MVNLMPTTFNVTATTDKAAYNTGDKVTVTITGDAISAPTESTVSVTLTLTADDGATGTASVQLPLTKPAATEDVKVTKVTDDQNHTWVIAGDGKSATTTL